MSRPLENILVWAEPVHDALARLAMASSGATAARFWEAAEIDWAWSAHDERNRRWLRGMR